jgi:hypothetical protein
VTGETVRTAGGFADHPRSLGLIIYSGYKKFDGAPVAQRDDDGYLIPEVTDFKAVDNLDAKLFE